MSSETNLKPADVETIAAVMVERLGRGEETFSFATRPNYADTGCVVVIGKNRAERSPSAYDDYSQGDVTSDMYTREEVDAVLAGYGLPGIPWVDVTETDEPHKEDAPALVGSTPVPLLEQPSFYYIHRTELAEAIDALKPGVTTYNSLGLLVPSLNELRVEKCCDYEGGHYSITVTTGNGSKHTVYDVGDIFELQSAIKRENKANEDKIIRNAECVYDGTIDAFRITYQGEEIQAPAYPYNYWTLDEIREQHGILTGRDSERRYRVTVPSNLFDSQEKL